MLLLFSDCNILYFCIKYFYFDPKFKENFPHTNVLNWCVLAANWSEFLLVNKGKALPSQLLETQEEDGMLDFHPFLDIWRNYDGRVVSSTHRPVFTPKESALYPFLSEVYSKALNMDRWIRLTHRKSKPGPPVLCRNASTSFTTCLYTIAPCRFETHSLVKGRLTSKEVVLCVSRMHQISALHLLNHILRLANILFVNVLYSRLDTSNFADSVCVCVCVHCINCIYKHCDNVWIVESSRSDSGGRGLKSLVFL